MVESQRKSEQGSFVDRLVKAIRILNPSYIPIHIFNLIVGVLVLWGVFRSINWPLIHDAPLMHYIANLILNGSVPYKDIFDMNMPGTYLIHMAILQFIGKGSLSFRVFDLAWLFATGLAIIYFCKPELKWAGLFAFFSFCLFHLGLGPFSMGQRDYLMLLFIMMGGISYKSFVLNPRINNWLLLTCGVFFGAAVLIKPFSIIMALLCLLPLLWKWKGSPGNVIQIVIMFSLGIMVPILLTGLWLYSIGGLSYFIDIFIGYLIPIYNNIYVQNVFSLIYILFFNALMIPILVLGIMSVKDQLHKKPEISFAMLGVIYGIFHYILQKRGSFYHVYPFYFFVILLGSFLIVNNLAKGIFHRICACLCAFLLIFTLGSTFFHTMSQNNTMAALKPSLIPLSEDLKKYKLASDETVQVFDTVGGGIHALYLLNIKQPSRFIYDIQFLHSIDQPYIQNLREELVSNLNSTPPKIIVVFDVGWHQSERKMARFSSFPELVGIIENNYSFAVDHFGYSIFVHK